jgi:protease I
VSLKILLLAAAMVLPAAVHAQEPAAAAKSKGVILMVIADKMYQDLELDGPKKQFEDAGFTVKVASKSGGECEGMMGGKAKSDLKLADAKAAGCAAVVFVGGPGCMDYAADPAVHKLAQDAARSCKVVAAICLAPNILANAGVLKGKKATCFNFMDAKKGGVTVVEKAVVRDGKVITANGPEAAEEFATEVLKALGVNPPAKKAAAPGAAKRPGTR